MQHETVVVHYGVKGMKWGVRHDPERVGRARRAATGSGRSQAVSVYQKNGFSKSDIQRMMLSKKIALGLLATAGGIAIGTVAFRAGRRVGYKYVDSVLKAGRNMQYLNTHNPGEMAKRTYATINNADKAIYKSAFVKHLSKNGKTVYDTTITATKNIRVPSEKNAIKVMQKLHAENPEYGKTALAELKNIRATNTRLHRNQKTVIDQAIKDLSDGKVTKSVYRANNYALVYNGKAGDMYYDALKKNGYGAITDVNDLMYSRIRGSRPTVVFDNEAAKITKSATVSKKDIRKASVTVSGRKYLPKAGAVGAVGAGAGVLGTTEAAQVREYRERHPSSRKSSAEIIRMLERGKR